MTNELLGRIRHDRVIDLASSLIEIEGHEDLPGHERGVAEWLAAHLRDVLPPERTDVRLEPVPGDRCNLVVTVHGGAPGGVLMFNAHLDTVPGYGMPAAYQPAMRDGRLYGRGAVDMKGALAAMVACVETLSAPDITFAGDLVLTALAGEESGSAGMQQLARTGMVADFAVVGEPTGLRIARAHKGAMWVEAAFRGIATHGSVPDEGVNAIHHAARFVSRVERQLAPRLRQRTHPLLGHATVNVGVVSGGDRPPMVPARCSVQIDRRWLPDERHAEVLDEFRAILSDMVAEDPQVNAEIHEMSGTSTFVHSPLECPPETPGLRVLQQVIADRGGVASDPIGVNFWTDAALLAEVTGTPTVVCGPGDIAQAHSLDEWVELSQLEAATEVYVDLAARYLGAELSGVPRVSTGRSHGHKGRS